MRDNAIFFEITNDINSQTALAFIRALDDDSGYNVNYVLIYDNNAKRNNVYLREVKVDDKSNYSVNDTRNNRKDYIDQGEHIDIPKGSRCKIESLDNNKGIQLTIKTLKTQGVETVTKTFNFPDEEGNIKLEHDRSFELFTDPNAFNGIPKYVFDTMQEEETTEDVEENTEQASVAEETTNEESTGTDVDSTEVANTDADSTEADSTEAVTVEGTGEAVPATEESTTTSTSIGGLINNINFKPLLVFPLIALVFIVVIILIFVFKPKGNRKNNDDIPVSHGRGTANSYVPQNKQDRQAKMAEVGLSNIMKKKTRIVFSVPDSNTSLTYPVKVGRYTTLDSLNINGKNFRFQINNDGYFAFSSNGFDNPSPGAMRRDFIFDEDNHKNWFIAGLSASGVLLMCYSIEENAANGLTLKRFCSEKLRNGVRSRENKIRRIFELLGEITEQDIGRITYPGRFFNAVSQRLLTKKLVTKENHPVFYSFIAETEGYDNSTFISDMSNDALCYLVDLANIYVLLNGKSDGQFEGLNEVHIRNKMESLMNEIKSTYPIPEKTNAVNQQIGNITVAPRLSNDIPNVPVQNTVRPAEAVPQFKQPQREEPVAQLIRPNEVQPAANVHPVPKQHINTAENIRISQNHQFGRPNTVRLNQQAAPANQANFSMSDLDMINSGKAQNELYTWLASKGAKYYDTSLTGGLSKSNRPYFAPIVVIGNNLYHNPLLSADTAKNEYSKVGIMRYFTVVDAGIGAVKTEIPGNAEKLMSDISDEDRSGYKAKIIF